MYKVTIFFVKNPNLLSPIEVHPGTCDQWALQVVRHNWGYQYELHTDSKHLIEAERKVYKIPHRMF